MNYADYKKREVDWNERESKLRSLCDKFRRNDGSYDALVPSSGGKDSAFVAHQLRHRYKMNPLCVTWSPFEYTQIGLENLKRFISSGFNNILGQPDGQLHRKLTTIPTKFY